MEFHVRGVKQHGSPETRESLASISIDISGRVAQLAEQLTLNQ